jgi:outer membrane protein assembly factor BamB/PKD repeat protein
MFRQNLQHTGQSPYDTSGNDGKLKWSFGTGDRIVSSAAIGSDGTIYIGSRDNKLYAINPSGTIIWSFTTGDSVYRSSPAIDTNGTIYIGSMDHKLYAINPDGTEKWSFMTGDSVIHSPAIGIDGTIYFGSSDNKLYALNSDGTEKWSYMTMGPVRNSPAIDSSGTIYIGSEKELYAINSDGTQKWIFTSIDWLLTSPAIGSDGTIYIGYSGNKFYAINPDGTEKWIFTAISSVDADPAIASDGSIYVGCKGSSDYKLYAINPDGTEKWNFTTDGIMSDSPAIGSDGTVYVGSWDGNLYAIGSSPQIKPPVAYAGPDQVTIEGGVVHFDGSVPYAPNGTIYSGEWDFDAGVDSDGDGNFRNDVDATGSNPTHIYGDDGVYNVTFTVNASVQSNTGESKNLDCVFCVDSSGSMSWNDPDDLRVIEAQNMVINHFDKPDRGAVVDFDNDAFLVPEWEPGDHLSTNYEKIIINLGLIDSGGGTILWNGLNVSNEEIRNHGNSSLTPILILITDAEELDQDPNDIPNSYKEANISASHGIRIFTVGLAVPSGGESEELLIDIADITGGKYYPASDPSHFRAIYDEISDIAKNITYVRMNDTDTMEVTVKNVAPKIELEGEKELTLESVALYNGPGSGDDISRDIAIDSIGNVYVTGSSYGGSTHDDYATIAYDPEGNELWSARHNGPGDGDDEAKAIIVDALQNVYVTGSFYMGSYQDWGTGNDYATIKYDSSGGVLWVALHDGPGNSSDSADAITMDASGNIIVTGNCEGDGSHSDIVTIKYDSSGSELWVATYESPYNNHDRVAALTTDSENNVIVTGYSYGDGTHKDMITIKYDPDGNTIWERRYDGPGNYEDSATDIAVDPMGNVYVVGYQHGWTTRQDYCTLKYNSTGYLLWMRRWMGFGDVRDYGNAIALDAEYNVYVTGRSYEIASNFDYVTVKYNTHGYIQWIDRYKGTGNYYDNPVDITVDSSQNVYVTGESFENTFSWDYATVVYDSKGNRLTVKKYDGDAIGDDLPTAMALDNNGNVYITGMSHQYRFGNFDYATTKYSRPFILECDEGSSITFSAIATDPGSDDLTYLCNWGDGTSNTTMTFYNNGVGPEPDYDPVTNEIKSSEGSYPCEETVTMTHVYGDNGNYSVTLTLSDDDGGNITRRFLVIVDNVAPTITKIRTLPGDEGSILTFEAEAVDPGSDDLTYSWEIEYGPTISNTYFNNGLTPEPVYDQTSNEIKSCIGNYPFTSSDMVTHCYGDDYIYTITLTVTDDDGGETSFTSTVSVNNTAPFITEIVMPYPAEEGAAAIFRATARDYGSDDLTFQWDFGDSSPVVTNTYYNDGAAPDPNPSPAGVFPFLAQDTVSHTYGDDSDYHITITVTDDDGGVITYTMIVRVVNVAPTIQPFGPFVLDEGSVIDITGIATDQGSDDLTFSWEIDGIPISSNTYYNDGIGDDPYPSPGGTYPFSITETVSSIFADDGNYSVILTVIDDDGGITIYETYVLVNNLPPSITSFNYTVLMVNAPRTVGYWGHQCEVEVPYGDHTGILQEWIDNISSQSQVFSWISTVEDVNDTVQFGDASEMVVMAERQLMGVWLNVVSGKLHPTTELYMPNLTVSKTVWDAILEIEDVILNSENRTELERVKDIADNINNGIGIAWGIVEFTASATDPGADDLSFHWDFGDGKTEDNLYPNPGGVFPFSAIDNVEHSYFAQGTFTVTLTVYDGDGGSSVITQIITF